MRGVAALAEDDLRAKGLRVLEANLGAVETLRFLALVNHEPFDYLAWQEREFREASLDDLFAEVTALEPSLK